MKRLFLISAIIITTLILSSCGEPPTVNSSFTAGFTAIHGEEEYAGTLSKDETSLSIVMSEPYTVIGTAIDFSDGKLRISSRGHSTTAAQDYLPEDSLPSVLQDCLSYLDQAEYRGTSDGVDSFIVPTSKGEAQICAREGMPISLTDTLTGWEFEFTDNN